MRFADLDVSSQGSQVKEREVETRGHPPKNDKPQEKGEFPWQPGAVAWQPQVPKILACRKLRAGAFPWPVCTP